MHLQPEGGIKMELKIPLQAADMLIRCGGAPFYKVNNSVWGGCLEQGHHTRTCVQSFSSQSTWSSHTLRVSSTSRRTSAS